MTTARSLVLMMAAGLLIGTPAQAQVALLFDNGAIDFSNGWEITLWTDADDFEIPFNAAATRVTMGMIDTYCNFPSNWDGILRWWIFNDDGGLPGGTVVATGISPEVTFFLSQDDCPSGWAM